MSRIPFDPFGMMRQTMDMFFNEDPFGFPEPFSEQFYRHLQGERVYVRNQSHRPSISSSFREIPILSADEERPKQVSQPIIELIPWESEDLHPYMGRIGLIEEPQEDNDDAVEETTFRDYVPQTNYTCTSTISVTTTNGHRRQRSASSRVEHGYVWK